MYLGSAALAPMARRPRIKPRNRCRPHRSDGGAISIRRKAILEGSLEPELVGHAVFALEGELRVTRRPDGVRLLRVAIVEDVSRRDVERVAFGNLVIERG